MNSLSEAQRAALRHAAHEATREWGDAKASMALRAVGLDTAASGRTSLEAIAAELGVSRETVRRARNELLHTIEFPAGVPSEAVYASLSLQPPATPSVDSPATTRALRRFLTMTGPLAWDEVLSAWARAGGKPPYVRLPAEVASMQAWASRVGGFRVSSGGTGSVVISATAPEELDQVSKFLYESLKDQPGGVDRSTLLELAEKAGLKATTIATTLSAHPAVTRVGRGMWALRGRQKSATAKQTRISYRRPVRVRPTAFSWDVDGSLVIEFSVPKGPSPVVAIPKAVSEIVEGREFTLDNAQGSSHLTVRKARAWGFGPVLSELDLVSGSRATLALNLLAGTAVIRAAEGKRASR